MTNNQYWLTIQTSNRCIVQQGNKISVDTTNGYAIPQPEDTLASFKLDAPTHPVDAHIERMESDAAQEIYAERGDW